MKKIILSYIAAICCISSQAQTKIINVEDAGTLSMLIDDSEKYEISDLTLSGKLNGDDINFIRQMAGGSQFDGFTNGKLSNLNMENVMIVQGGSYKSGGRTYYYTSNLEIGQRMFAYLEKLELIMLPKTLKSIGAEAFYDCINLKKIEIPDNTFSIDIEAFSGCESLEYVILGKNVEEIRNGRVFSFCNNLKYFIVPEENGYFKSIDGVLYSKNGKTLIRFPNAKSSTYSIPQDVKIGDCSFSGCISLESIYIPEDLTEIGDYAFELCENLKTVNIPENISVLIGTFSGCTSLTSIVIPSNVQRIFDSFNGCENLKEIYCKNSVPPYPAYFQGVNTIDCILYIPQGSYDAYYKSEGWRNFLNIIEIDYTSTNNLDYNKLSIYGYENSIIIQSNIFTNVDIYSITGIKYNFSINIGLNIFTLPKGIYVANGEKIIIQ
ncbi:MAG: leucine-rich repeat domain-containing protein [Candidatus Azobacteroides sp.]|nr:leucine-rich repeat domain-containing protein [Candidatus Azobacteroides sp.]